MGSEIERVVRDLYEARARWDLDAVGSLLAEDVGWHEPGEEDYSGHHRGRDTVLALLARLREVTDGTFTLEPTDLLVTAEHVVAKIRWSARRGDAHVTGNEIAVYRIRHGQVAEAWFYLDGHDPEMLTQVFSYENS
ncbi:nuclear transport factor 2 family protein [Actinomadura sp. KC345]|uniref:nuclear transport factor 2 family protein n=1 Tax=Actinomadura sp. KC345 TaxID=2530371 RepID=UPI00104C5779|nr:nuclear transport factor 2 family protein [Actinomadura sp. KC345]TDC58729.1 nuclear transport factor 2 family protein [Actinomadura sp. KC345]